jgi:hypothetical protein
MHRHFYVMPCSKIKEIKKDTFRDMGEKLKLWKHKLKRKLQIQRGQHTCYNEGQSENYPSTV